MLSLKHALLAVATAAVLPSIAWPRMFPHGSGSPRRPGNIRAASPTIPP